MKMGLDIDSWRGWESTGIALVPEKSKDAPIVYKRALNGRDFIQLKQVEKYLADIEKYSVAIGHNRAATTGRGNIVDHNAHPFQYGRITLVHNGHIRNTNELKGAQEGAGCLVDSAHVAYSMNANGELATLEQIEGGFVLVWWNSDTGLLNIARNTERPMHMAFADKENTFYWASELTELLHLLKDVEIDEEIGILYPKALNWYQFDIQNLREFKKVPFVRRQGRRTTTHQTGLRGEGALGAWTDEELAEWEAGNAVIDSTKATRRSSSTISDSAEIDEIRETVSNQRLKDAKLSGIPTSKKRISRAKTELKKLGIEYNAMRNCTPTAWCKYKNQNNLGSVLATTKKGGLMVEVLQVRQEQFREYADCGNLLVDCVNVRNGPNNDVRIVGIVSPKMKTYLERSKRKEKDAEDAGIGPLDRDYDGPDGIKVTLARFIELANDGCANCQSDIDPKQHGAIVWVGRPPSAICPECATDQGVMELLGLSQQYRKAAVH